MRISIDFTIPGGSILQLRKLLHSCVDTAFSSNYLRSNTIKFSTKNEDGTTSFSIHMDEDCRESIKYAVSEEQRVACSSMFHNMIRKRS